jgi:hypothetical protein
VINKGKEEYIRETFVTLGNGRSGIYILNFNGIPTSLNDLQSSMEYFNGTVVQMMQLKTWSNDLHVSRVYQLAMVGEETLQDLY